MPRWATRRKRRGQDGEAGVARVRYGCSTHLSRPSTISAGTSSGLYHPPHDSFCANRGISGRGTNRGPAALPAAGWKSCADGRPGFPSAIPPAPPGRAQLTRGHALDAGRQLRTAAQQRVAQMVRRQLAAAGHSARRRRRRRRRLRVGRGARSCRSGRATVRRCSLDSWRTRSPRRRRVRVRDRQAWSRPVRWRGARGGGRGGRLRHAGTAAGVGLCTCPAGGLCC